MSEELKRGIPKAIVVGKVKSTKEEREKSRKDFERILREDGVLKENESIDVMNHIETPEDLERIIKNRERKNKDDINKKGTFG